MLAPLQRLRFVRDHRWTPGRLSDYLDGGLGPRPRARVEHHLARCPQCLAALRGLEQLLDALHGLGGAGPQERVPDIAAEVRRRLQKPGPTEPG